jgi:putative transposase
MVNAWDKESALVYHDEYLKLDKDKDARCYAYRELFKYKLSEHDIHFIEKAEEYCQPVGDDRFKKDIEEKYGIKLGQMSRGRPKKRGVKI